MANRNLIGSERRRRILDLLLQNGSLSVFELANMMDVVENTIRRDLEILQADGIIVRSHGGASVIDRSLPSRPYSQTRDTNLQFKSWIASAAVQHIPTSGSIFINAGSTTHQLALRTPKDLRLHIGTNSPDIASYLAMNTASEVDLFGGKLIGESMETDGTLCGDILDNLNWDVSFLGISSIDPRHGVTSINLNIALLEKRILAHSRKAIALCDSSKFGRFSHARVGPPSIVNTIITDTSVDMDIASAISARGVEILIVGDGGETVTTLQAGSRE